MLHLLQGDRHRQVLLSDRHRQVLLLGDRHRQVLLLGDRHRRVLLLAIGIAIASAAGRQASPKHFQVLLLLLLLLLPWQASGSRLVN